MFNCVLHRCRFAISRRCLEYLLPCRTVCPVARCVASKSTSSLGFQPFDRQLPHFSSRVDGDRATEAESITVGEVMGEWTERFLEEAIPEAELSVELIVAHALNRKMFHELGCDAKAEVLGQNERLDIEVLCLKRLKRMPVQYIIGEWDFRDMTLKMRPPVFIPRPESEVLVEIISGHYGRDNPLNILEIGCGSGAIGLSLLRIFNKSRVVAFDGLTEAVQLTKENAQRYGLLDRLSVHHELVTSGVPSALDKNMRFDAVVSNPPYIFHKDLDELEPEVILYEDHLALDGGIDGGDVIFNIIRLSEHVLKPGGFIWLETDTRHPKIVQRWLTRHPEIPVRFVRSFQDSNDRPRFCQLQFTEVD